MVKVAIAGASGQLAQEILDGLVKAGKHGIVALVRKDPKSFPVLSGVQWMQTNYENKTHLIDLLDGVHTVMSFFATISDPDGVNQKRLIDAAVEAGVKRYAASEWAIGEKLDQVVDIMPWYEGRLEIRDYLEKLNQEKKVLEYTLFHPGLFMNYLVFPQQTTQHISLFPLLYDLQNMRAVVTKESIDVQVTYTTIQDIVAVVAKAIEYPGEWPTTGGIAGCNLTHRQLLELGEKIRGKPFDIEWLEEKDLRSGILKASWLPPYDHTIFAALPNDERDAFTRAVVIGTLLGNAKGAWRPTDEWNRLLPDHKFTSVEEFLRKVWQ